MIVVCILMQYREYSPLHGIVVVVCAVIQQQCQVVVVVVCAVMWNTCLSQKVCFIQSPYIYIMRTLLL